MGIYYEEKEKPNGCAIAVAVLFLLFLLVGMLGGGGESSSYDPGKSALEKLDRGEPLTEAEKKRLNDILFDPRWDGDR